MEPITILHATNHYRNNADHYNSVRARLSATKQRFLDGDKYEQIRMLQVSHAFAALSVQTSVENHERAFRNLFADGMPDSLNEVRDSINMCNYWKSKAKYVWDSVQNVNKWWDVAEMLENKQVDKAHKFIIDEFLGVSTAKAPFVLSMLGFTQKMCLDTNICQIADIERPSTVVVERYENIVQNVRDKFQTLKEEASEPFIFQWALFDYKRGNLSTHEPFFEVIHSA